MKHRDIQVEICRQQRAIPSLIANQFFGAELSIRVHAQINRQRNHRGEVRELNVLIEA